MAKSMVNSPLPAAIGAVLVPRGTRRQTARPGAQRMAPVVVHLLDELGVPDDLCCSSGLTIHAPVNGHLGRHRFLLAPAPGARTPGLSPCAPGAPSARVRSLHRTDTSGGLKWQLVRETPGARAETWPRPSPQPAVIAELGIEVLDLRGVRVGLEGLAELSEPIEVVLGVESSHQRSRLRSRDACAVQVAELNSRGRQPAPGAIRVPSQHVRHQPMARHRADRLPPRHRPHLPGHHQLPGQLPRPKSPLLIRDTHPSQLRTAVDQVALNGQRCPLSGWSYQTYCSVDVMVTPNRSDDGNPACCQNAYASCT